MGHLNSLIGIKPKHETKMSIDFLFDSFLIGFSNGELVGINGKIIIQQEPTRKKTIEIHSFSIVFDHFLVGINQKTLSSR
jgi:hypothetical protein